EQRVCQDGQRHRPFAADIVGQYAAEQPTQPPTENGDRNDRAGIDGNELVLGRVQELVQGRADGEDHRKDLEAVEGPSEVRGDQCFPLRRIERAIPWRRPRRRLMGAGFAHLSLPQSSLAGHAGGPRNAAYANIPCRWNGGWGRRAQSPPRAGAATVPPPA